MKGERPKHKQRKTTIIDKKVRDKTQYFTNAGLQTLSEFNHRAISKLVSHSVWDVVTAQDPSRSPSRAREGGKRAMA